MAKRNMRKNVDLTGPEMVIPSWPRRIATSSVAVTAPSPMPLMVNLPNQYPRPSEMKIAISGYWRSVATNQSNMGPPSGIGSGGLAARRGLARSRRAPGSALRRGLALVQLGRLRRAAVLLEVLARLDD